MAKYLFRLEKLHVNFQRDKSPNGDWDVVTFGIEVGLNQFGPLRNYGSYTTYSGSDVDFTKSLRSNSKQVQQGRWEIGPIDVADNDVVTVDYAIVNAHHTLSNSTSPGTAIQISLGTWATLVAIGGVAGGAYGAVVAAIVAGIAAAGLILLGGDRPNCDGVVGGNKRVFTGAELKQATNNPQQMFLVSDPSGNPDIPAACGHPSDIVTTFSVTFVPYESLKGFLISKFNLNAYTNHWTAGFRDYTKSGGPPQLYSGPTTSVRYIVENWELLIPWS
jgi:hypothetical protein